MSDGFFFHRQHSFIADSIDSTNLVQRYEMLKILLDLIHLPHHLTETTLIVIDTSVVIANLVRGVADCVCHFLYILGHLSIVHNTDGEKLIHTSQILLNIHHPTIIPCLSHIIYFCQ